MTSDLWGWKGREEKIDFFFRHLQCKLYKELVVLRFVMKREIQ